MTLPTYKVPTNFRAVRKQADYVLSADGYEFGTFMKVEDDLYQFVTNTGMLREELRMDERPYLVTKHGFKSGLEDIKEAYIRQDKYCFDECYNDMLTELRLEQHLEYFAPHADDTLREDMMGLS